MDRKWSSGGWTGIPTPKVGTGTLEKKKNALNKATKELEDKVKNLQQRTRTLPQPNSGHESLRTHRNNSVKSSESFRVSRSLTPPRGQGRLLRELPNTPSRESMKSEDSSSSTLRRRGSSVGSEDGGGKKAAGTVTSRIREREAEFLRQVVERDGQIKKLKERLKVLSTKLSETREKEKLGPNFKTNKEREKWKQNSLEEGTELQNIIRQVTKERLQLERHLQIANDSLQRNSGVDLHKYLSLESTNQHLRSQLDSLDILQQEYRLVEIQHREKEEACKELMNTLKYKSSLLEDLESKLAQVMEKNTELTIQNTDLQKQVVELHHVSDECAQLKNSLNQMETECVTAKSEVKSLSGKVRNLESVLDEMQRAAESRRQIEAQHKEALENLRRKQDEVEIVATKKQAETIEQMKKKIQELEAERKTQNERHQELILEMAELKRYGTGGHNSTHSSLLPTDLEHPSENLEIDEIMAKLEQDNKFLAELEKQRAAANNNHHGNSTIPSSSSSKAGSSANSSGGDSPPHHRAGSAITDSGFLSQSSLNGGNSSPVTLRERTVSTSSMNHPRSVPLELPRVSGADKINLLNGGTYSASVAAISMSRSNLTKEDLIDSDGMVDIPGKGWSWIYIAKYSYDPFAHSPNDTPEAELALNAGDYILVWSDPDDDGFFDGEILDGRKGLVPSNFVERLEGQELIEFYQSVFFGIGDGGDSICTSIAQDLDFISSDEGAEDTSQRYFKSRKATLSYYASCTDLDMTEDEGVGDISPASDYVAPPKHITLETQLNKSMLVGWSMPDCTRELLDSFQVLVDGKVCATVKATEKLLKATVIGYDINTNVHRISVKSIGVNRKSSTEAACTMVIGKDAPLGPTVLRATRIRTTSATVAWMPSNTNFSHTLLLNNVEVRTVKQGVFKHTIAGLSPNTVYKVTVRAKNIKAATSTDMHSVSKLLDTLSSHLEIKTLPQGLPDPPLDVQVELATEAGCLNVMWLPVTITPNGLSNGAPVTGYIIYLDGQKVKDITDPTADSAIIRVPPNSCFEAVTVRTKSKDKLSQESFPCRVPSSMSNKPSHIPSQDPDSDSDNELLEKLASHASLLRPRELIINYAAPNGVPVATAGGGIGIFPADLDSDIGPSELSDIAEEPEDELTDDSESVCSRNSRISLPKININNNNYPSSSSSLTKSVSNISSGSSNHGSSTLILGGSISNISNSKSFSTSVSSLTATSNNNSVNHSYNNYSNNIHNSKSSINNSYKSTNLNTWSTTTTTTTPYVSTSVSSSVDSKLNLNESSPHHMILKTNSNLYTEQQQQQQNAATGRKSSNSTVVVIDQSETQTAVDDSDTYKVSTTTQQPKNERVRIFVALFDYDPPTMSPNPDACDEELPFREGQLIKVFGEKDGDGFYWGEAGGKSGYVPCNMVSEVQVDDASVAEELFQEQSGSHSAGTSTNAAANNKHHQQDKSSPDRWADIYEDMSVKRKIALYDYDPRELSPNVDSEVELSFRTGDIILIYGEMDDDGFFMGEIEGQRGLVPSNFLADIPKGMDSKTLLYQMLGAAAVGPSATAGPRVLGQQRQMQPVARW